MAASTVVLNICSNLISYKSRKQLWIAFIIFCVALRSYYRRRRRLRIAALPRKPLAAFKEEPLITFSGGGQLGFYYQGVASYLKDNFDLEHVRFAGISAGSTAAASLAARYGISPLSHPSYTTPLCVVRTSLPTEASMVFGLRWFKLVANRRLKLFLMDPELMCKIGTEICEDFGITDAYIKAHSAKLSLSLRCTPCP